MSRSAKSKHSDRSESKDDSRRGETIYTSKVYESDRERSRRSPNPSKEKSRRKRYEEPEEEDEILEDLEDEFLFGENSKQQNLRYNDIDRRKEAPDISRNSEGSGNISNLSKCIKDCEELLNIVKPDIEQVEKLKSAYAKIVNSGCFEEDEKEEYRNSLQYHVERLRESISGVVEKANTAKMLCMQKANLMQKLLSEGCLDKGIIRSWSASMKTMDQRIERIDQQLQFLNMTSE